MTNENNPGNSDGIPSMMAEQIAERMRLCGEMIAHSLNQSTTIKRYGETLSFGTEAELLNRITGHD